MKMTKIAFWRKVKENYKNDWHGCYDVRCHKCPYKEDEEICKTARCKTARNEDKILALAEAYIKRHESKSKKKDHILDTTKKVEEPKPIKTVGIDNSDVTLAQHKPTPLEIAKMIRDNGYNCNDLTDYTCFQGRCPLSELRCGWSPNLSPNKESERKKLIDDYIALNEPCEPLASGMCSNPFDYCEEDCPANSEIPKPIRLPDFVYSASKNGVGFIDTKNRTFNTNDKGELLLNDNPCFATPEEALQVAKKLWNGDGK